MQQEHGAPREAAIRARMEAGDIDGGATEAIRLYGPEIYGFLLALGHGDEPAADEVFSAFCEHVWRGLPGFTWRSSLRTWVYCVARNDFSAHRRSARRSALREVPLCSCPEVAEAAACARTETLSFVRTERRREIDRLRDELPEEDRSLLILRVNRELTWLELARIFLGEEVTSPEALQRESARLRKRFQIIKQRLLQLGQQRGLIPEREM
jgi:RNA polymerase sigma-70 factor, ECF subfamily